MGIHKNKKINETEMENLSQLIHTIEEASDLKRIQCVYLRGLGLPVKMIAQVTQHSVGHVKRIWTLYFKEGIEGLKIKPRGGRRHFNLTEEEETDLLANYTTTGESGTMLEIGPLYKGLCEKVGRKVGVVSAYRLAKRHGWRKVAPRPEHPGRNPKAAQYFKVFFSKTD